MPVFSGRWNQRCQPIQKLKRAQLHHPAGLGPWLAVRTGPVDRLGWQVILDGRDLLVAAYDQDFFRVNGSGIVTDALANGIPIVVRAETTLASLLREHGCGTATFAYSTVEAVAQAVAEAVKRYAEHCNAAQRGRESWAAANSPVPAARGVLNCFSELS